MDFNEAVSDALYKYVISLFTDDNIVIEHLGLVVVKGGYLWEEGNITTAMSI
ncbi:hypothetical protein [Bacillus sp. REN3]|uniref:hypothetical protein n=1 Tax=Bacillus sp. REN3 TaxID=2802440 RepID=UPI001AEE2C5A|nr:hypothetical protein [Bacillus sp. REN3]